MTTAATLNSKGIVHGTIAGPKAMNSQESTKAKQELDRCFSQARLGKGTLVYTYISEGPSAAMATISKVAKAAASQSAQPQAAVQKEERKRSVSFAPTVSMARAGAASAAKPSQPSQVKSKALHDPVPTNDPFKDMVRWLKNGDYVVQHSNGNYPRVLSKYKLSGDQWLHYYQLIENKVRVIFVDLQNDKPKSPVDELFFRTTLELGRDIICRNFKVLEMMEGRDKVKYPVLDHVHRLKFENGKFVPHVPKLTKPVPTDNMITDVVDWINEEACVVLKSPTIQLFFHQCATSNRHWAITKRLEKMRVILIDVPDDTELADCNLPYWINFSFRKSRKCTCEILEYAINSGTRLPHAFKFKKENNALVSA